MLKKGLLWLFIVLLLVFSVNALEASIGKPKMILYKNITTEEPLVFEKSVIVQNKNDYDVQINIEPLDDFIDKIEIYEPEFILKAHEEKEAFYKITIEKPGYYKGGTLVKFSTLDDSKVGVALAQRVIVIVKGEGDFEEEIIEEEPEEEVVVEQPEEEVIVIGEPEEEEVIEEESPAGMAVEDVAKPNILIGVLIIIGIVLIGVLIYSLIFLRGAKK